jgi:hypothetical protein
VEPFPLPNLLPLCGLAPAALHAVVEQTMAPLFDATFRPRTASSSRPGDLNATLLQVAGHPDVENGQPSVRLQMALEMVAYAAALTPLADPQSELLADALASLHCAPHSCFFWGGPGLCWLASTPPRAVNILPLLLLSTSQP